jgi:hypothetical protein
MDNLETLLLRARLRLREQTGRVPGLTPAVLGAAAAMVLGGGMAFADSLNPGLGSAPVVNPPAASSVPASTTSTTSAQTQSAPVSAPATEAGSGGHGHHGHHADRGHHGDDDQGEQEGDD